MFIKISNYIINIKLLNPSKHEDLIFYLHSKVIIKNRKSFYFFMYLSDQ